MNKMICPHCNMEIDMQELTPREFEVIKLKVKGLKNPAIGKKLYISDKTVKNHVGSIYRKTNTTNPLELVKYLLEKGLIKPEDIG